MSEIDKSITNDQVIPVVETRLFEGREEHHFAVGMVAVGDQIILGREEEYKGYLQLRGKVYGPQTRMIPLEAVQKDGTEIDEDDPRSVHWAVFEKTATGDNDKARVIGTIRTIIKSDADPRPLPIEDFFKDEVALTLPVNSVEVSRYIARHEDDSIQNLLNVPLFQSVVSYVTAHGLAPTYGVVEEDVERQLIRDRVPLKRIAEPKYVEEYSADNLGIEVFIEKMAEFWGMNNPESIEKILANEQEITYFNIVSGEIEQLKAA